MKTIKPETKKLVLGRKKKAFRMCPYPIVSANIVLSSWKQQSLSCQWSSVPH